MPAASAAVGSDSATSSHEAARHLVQRRAAGGSEKSFFEKIGVIRNKELQMIRIQAIYRALYFALSMSVPIITTTLALAVYTLGKTHDHCWDLGCILPKCQQ